MTEHMTGTREDLLAIGGGPVVEGIIDVRQASIGSRRRAVSLRGILHLERLVRPFVIAAID